MLIQNGADIKDVQRRLGHADLEITLKFYYHPDVYVESSGETVNLLDNLI